MSILDGIVTSGNSSSASRHIVEEAGAGIRLDRFLASRIETLSRARLQELIRGGQVTANGRSVTDPSAKVREGESFEVEVPPVEPYALAGEPIALTVVYEDESLIVIDKPAGLVVHPGAGNLNGTLVNALIAHCGKSLSGIGGVARPGIVHRLDKDTSGLMVAAKTDAAHRGLARQFADHGRTGDLRRQYMALVWGEPGRGRPYRNPDRAPSHIPHQDGGGCRGRPDRHHHLRNPAHLSAGHPFSERSKGQAARVQHRPMQPRNGAHASGPRAYGAHRYAHRGRQRLWRGICIKGSGASTRMRPKRSNGSAGRRCTRLPCGSATR